MKLHFIFNNAKDVQKVTFIRAAENILVHVQEQGSTVVVYILYMPSTEDKEMHFPQLLEYLLKGLAASTLNRNQRCLYGAKQLEAEVMSIKTAK